MNPQATIADLYGNFPASFLAPFIGGSSLCGLDLVPSSVGMANDDWIVGADAAYLACFTHPAAVGSHLHELGQQRFSARLDLAG